MSEHGQILFYFPLFAVLFGWLCFVIWSVIIKDGWRLLSKHYRTSLPATGKVWTFDYVYIGWTSYRNLVILTTNDDGIFMELFWLVRFGRPRLFIPWSDFHNPTLNTFFFWRNVKAEVGNPAITTVRLPPAIFEQTEGRKLLPQSPIGTNVPT